MFIVLSRKFYYNEFRQNIRRAGLQPQHILNTWDPRSSDFHRNNFPRLGTIFSRNISTQPSPISPPFPILSALTDEQKQVVETTDTHVMTISAPGTGKTHCLAAKMVYLSQKRKIPSEKILVLTLSERSTNVVRQFVDENMPFLGNSGTICSLNNFAFSMLREYISHKLHFKVMSESEQQILFRENEGCLGLSRFKSENSVYNQKSVLNYFDLLGSYHVTPEKYTGFVKCLESDLGKKIPEISKLGNKQQETNHQNEFLKIHRELAEAYEKFSDVKHRNNLLTPNDVLFLAIRTFREQPSFREFFLQKYSHVLVDEIQDFTFLQYNFLEMMIVGENTSGISQPTENIGKIETDGIDGISRGSGSKCGPVFTFVGDDDQAVNEWKGGKTAIFSDLAELLPDMVILTLTINMRCSPPILEAIRKLILNNKNRMEAKFGISKNVTTKFQTPPEPNYGLGVQALRFKDKDEENIGILNLVKSIFNKEPEASISLLVPSQAMARDYIRQLKNRGVFVNSISRTIPVSPIVRLLVSWLVGVSCPHRANKEAYEILRSEIYGIPPENSAEIFEISERIKKPLLQVAEEYTLGKNLGETVVKNIQRMTEDYRWYGKKLQEMSPLLLLSEFLRKTTFFDKFRNPKTEYQDQVGTEIKKFLKSVKKLEDQIRQKNSEVNPINFAQLLQRMALSGELTESGEYTEMSGSVAVGTMYTVKNLEFDYVICSSATEFSIPGKFRHTELTIPENLYPPPPMDQKRHVEERRRLVYMCMSRARKMFFFVYSDQLNKNHNHDKPSRFILEAMGAAALKNEHPHQQQLTEDTEEAEGGLPSASGYNGGSLAGDMFRSTDVLNLSKYTAPGLEIQFDALRTYLRCPVMFGMKNVLKIESVPTKNNIYQAAVFGTLKAMKQPENQKILNLDDTRKLFEQKFLDNGIDANSIPSNAYDSAMAIFEKAYFNADHYQTLHINYPWKLKIDDKTQFTGEIHEIYCDDDDRNVIVQHLQYEEMTLDLTLSKLSILSNILALVCNREFNFVPDQVTLEYIHYKRIKQVTFHPLEKELETTLKLLQNLAKQIIEGKYRGSTKINLCKSCPYKTNCPHSLVAENK